MVCHLPIAKLSWMPPAPHPLKGRAFIRDNEAKQLAELEAAGVQVERNPDIDAFRKATAPVIDSIKGDTRKIVDDIRNLLK